MSVSVDIQQDLSHLLQYMTDLQKKRAWRNALNRTARKVRKVAVTDLNTTGIRHAAKIARSIRASVPAKLTGFSVKVTPSRNPKSYYINSRGAGVAMAQFAHTGTNRIHQGSTKAYNYLDRARKAAYPAALAELGDELEKTSKDAVAKSIKKHYGIKR